MVTVSSGEPMDVWPRTSNKTDRYQTLTPHQNNCQQACGENDEAPMTTRLLSCADVMAILSCSKSHAYEVMHAMPHRPGLLRVREADFWAWYQRDEVIPCGSIQSENETASAFGGPRGRRTASPSSVQPVARRSPPRSSSRPVGSDSEQIPYTRPQVRRRSGAST